MAEEQEGTADSPTPSESGSVETVDLPEGLFGLSPSTMSPLARDMDLRTADFRRRDRERQMVSDEQSRIKIYKDIRMRQKEEEQKRDKEMLATYDPWGRPGGGAPTPGDHNLKQVVSKEYNGLSSEQASRGFGNDDDELLGGLLRGLGRPGAGAPLRTGSGRLHLQLSGDPELRFGAKVGQSIENGIRYKGPGKENYRQELDNLVLQKQEARERERLLDRQQEEEQGKLYPFGRRSANKQRNSSGFGFPSSLDFEEEKYHPWGQGLGNPRRDQGGNVFGQKRQLFPSVDTISENGIVYGAAVMPPAGGRGGGGAPQRTSTGTLQARYRHPTARSEPGTTSVGGFLPEVNEDEGYNPWGRPGHGAPFGRSQGQNFMQKMGWSTSNEDHRDDAEAKRVYLSELQTDMVVRKEKHKLEREELFSQSNPLVDLMLNKETGRPKRDPDTGKLLSQVKGHSDVTAQRLGIRRLAPSEHREYHSALRRQTEEQKRLADDVRDQERAKLREHLDTWNTLWGKPGNGAPRQDNNKRVDLNNVLFANGIAQTEENKSLTRYGRGRHYEFQAPWAATIY